MSGARPGPPVLRPLTFDRPDLETFPCLGLAMEAAKAGGTAGAVLSGANEVAVGLYLLDQVGFYDIYDLVKQALDRVPFVKKPDLGQILAADRWPGRRYMPI